MTQFVTKDSGRRVTFDSGMVRDTNEGKARFDLTIPLGMPYPDQMLTRWALLMARGAEKYGDRNWEKAATEAELDRFRESAVRHFMQWLMGETDEDHAAAIFYNVQGAEFVEWKLGNLADEPDPDQDVWDYLDGPRLTVPEPLTEDEAEAIKLRWRERYAASEPEPLEVNEAGHPTGSVHCRTCGFTHPVYTDGCPRWPAREPEAERQRAADDLADRWAEFDDAYDRWRADPDHGEPPHWPTPGRKRPPLLTTIFGYSIETPEGRRLMKAYAKSGNFDHAWAEYRLILAEHARRKTMPYAHCGDIETRAEPFEPCE